MKFSVRNALVSDLDELVRLRDERLTVYLKSDARVRAAAPDNGTWRTALSEWTGREDVAVLVAEREEQLIGYMVGWVWEMPPIFEPRRVGVVTEMSVDGHCKQGGVGTAMFKDLQGWFKAQGLDHIEVRIPRQQPIEQAFWRAVGAKPYFDHMYFKLD